MILPQAQTGAGGDPHFVGFNGEHYDFMGAPDKWFVILSDPELYINAKLVALPGNSWGTFFGKISIGYANNQVMVTRLQDRIGLVATCNGNRIGPGFGSLRIEGQDLVLETSRYIIRVSRVYYERDWDDSLNGVPHLDLLVELGSEWTKGIGTHGVLGQTATTPVVGIPTGGCQGEGIIEGVWTNYQVSGPWATDYTYNLSRTFSS